MTVRLEDIVDVDRLHEAISDRDVTCRDWSEDTDYKVLCYSKSAQIYGVWNDVTLTMRGVVVDTTNTDGEISGDSVVVARSFKKFFAIAARSNGKLDKIDDDEDVVVSTDVSFSPTTRVDVFDKVDGTMGVGFIGPDGLLHIATKGAFGSKFSAHAENILRSKHDLNGLSEYVLENLHDENLIFEIISPQFEHVIDYGKLDDLVLLGKIRVSDGYWTPLDSNSELAKRFGLKTTVRYPENTLGDAIMLPDVRGREGVVVTTYLPDGSQELYKIKYESYLTLRRDLVHDREQPSIIKSTLKTMRHVLKTTTDREHYGPYVMFPSENAIEAGVYDKPSLLDSFGMGSENEYVADERFKRTCGILDEAHHAITEDLKCLRDLDIESMSRAEVHDVLSRTHPIAFAYVSSMMDGRPVETSWYKAFAAWIGPAYEKARRELHESNDE